MRIFFSGDENAARWHLPVAQAKVGEFVKETEKSGLKQNRFTFLFKETGAIVHAQYVFGQVSMQIHAPSIPMIEEVEEEIAEAAVGPKTFWVNTTQGYFWVEVRYTDGVPRVILTPFEAISGEGFIYPGFALTAPGMISGSFDDTPESRFVLSQNGGVMSGAAEGKGTVQSIAIIDNASRLTVLENNGAAHDFVLIQNVGGKEIEMRRVGISYVEGAISVERKYASINMAYEGQTSLHVANLSPTPAWIHRKCLGSYFSPNKTIGYHVDIGGDDSFLGNLDATYGGDLLDNSGGFGESLFNHTPDLYRIAGLLAFPVSVSGEKVTLLLVSPTMGFTDDPNASKKCWGGYGLTQDWAGCVDYAQDKNSWLLSPRFVLCTVDLSNGARSFQDPGNSESSVTQFNVRSWDDKFGGSFVYETECSCDTDFYSVMETNEADEQCAWTEECSWTCDTNDPGSTGECPRGWTPYSHWEYFSREDIRNSKRAYFLFGTAEPAPTSPGTMNGFYFLFDGLWHLDIGVFWTTSRIDGNYCGLCMYPYGSQDPGETVVFSVQGVDTSQLLLTGHEYVKNMEVVTPLGYVAWPLGGTTVGFVARVPEEYEAPHDPVMMTGGVEYRSGDVDGEVVRCERSLMSSPCICESNELTLDPASVLNLGQANTISVLNGCAPFTWAAINAVFNSHKFEVTDQRSFLVTAEDDCATSVSIKDACGTTVSMYDAYSISGAVYGPDVLDVGEQGTYTHNLDNASYTGTLELIEQSGNSAVLQMPSDASYGDVYVASWSGKCESVATTDVSTLPECQYEYDHVQIGENWGIGPAPAYIGAKVLVVNYRNTGTNRVFSIFGLSSSNAQCLGCSVGKWKIVYKPGFAGTGHVLIECNGGGGNGDFCFWHVADPLGYC